jgi:hypothetical protein
MNKHLSSFLLMLSFVFCLSAVAFGQQQVGTIEGTVKDVKGAAIPGATVTITGVSVGFERKVQSDSEGVYRVLQVPAGTYKIVTAATSGFAAATLENVTVVIEKTTTADITVGISETVNTVEIAGDALGAVLDTTDSKVQTNITSQLIELLPKGTNFQSILKIAPGVRPEPLSGGYQVDGASGSENSFIIDGQALENFRTGTLNSNNNIPTSLVQEVQVKVGGFEAEHGGASGGVVSVATKGGSDHWRSEVGTQFDTSRFNPGSRFAPTSFFDNSSAANAATGQHLYAVRSPKAHYTNYYPTLSLGGPIIKSRVWFYGNYSPQVFPTRRTTTFYNNIDLSNFSGATTNQAPAGVASGVNLVLSTTFPPATYRAKTTNEYAFGRIDAAILNNLRYSGTFLWNPTVSDGAIPYGTLSIGGSPNARDYNGQHYTDTEFQALKGGRSNSNNWTNQLIYTPTSKLVLTGRYTRAFLNEKNGNYAALSGTWWRCQGTTAAYTLPIAGSYGCPPPGRNYSSGSTANVLRDVSKRNETTVDASYLTSFFGSHEFKGGYQIGRTVNDVSGSSFADPYLGRITLQYGRNFNYYFGNNSLNGNCDLRTTANPAGTCLGVGQWLRFGTNGIGSNRYQATYFQDKWRPTSRLTLNLGLRLENENLPAFNTAGGGQPIKFGWGKKIAPRLGVSWDPFGSGKTRIYGSYGLFYDRLKFELPRGSFGGDLYRIDYFPIPASHPEYTYYQRTTVLGNWDDRIGGGNPSTAGGLSVYQSDYRIPSNLTEQQAHDLGLPFAGVDPNLKPFRQSEFTVGVERELSKLFVISARFTRKNVDSAIEDHGILSTYASENYIISNPGEGRALELDQAEGYAKSIKPQRLFKGLEIVLNKRLSNHYFFNVNYTLSRLYGNYSGLASSDEGGRTSPGVNRFFDYIVNGFTFTGDPDNGNLPTDRRHAIKAYGGYDFNWFGSKTHATEISFFQQILQGTPQTTFMGIEGSSIVFSKRGDLGRTPTFWQTDASLTHRIKFGNEGRFTLAFDLNVLNLWNSNIVTALNTNRYAFDNTIGFADIDPTYDPDVSSPVIAFNRILNGQFTPTMVDTTLANRDDPNPRNVLYSAPSGYQAARNVRFGIRFYF